MSGTDEQKSIIDSNSSAEKKLMCLDLDYNATSDNRVDVEMSAAYKISFLNF